MSAADFTDPVSQSSGTQPAYTVYKMDISYFSGKLECYLRNKGVDYTAVEADARVLNRVQRATGIKKVPAVVTEDGRWLFDTTPTIQWFEHNHPQRPMLPSDPALRFIALLVEDYADEWLWRPAMWWRWEPVASRRALALRIAHNVDPPGVPNWLMARYFAWRQRQTWIWGDGVTRETAGAVRDLYFEELDWLETVLSQQPFLLGERPSVADFGYFASMFRHFGNDPDPAEVMRRRAPSVYTWLSRMWEARDGAYDAEWQWPDARWTPLWTRITGDYLPYLRANSVAFTRGVGRFDFTGASQQFRGTVTHNYRAWCLSVLQREWQALDDEQRARIDALVALDTSLAYWLGGAVAETGLDDMFAVPRPPGDHRPSLRVALFGQARN